MKIVILYLLGLFLTVIGLFFIIINLNLLVIGYSFGKYVKFIISNIECLSFFIGLILITLVYERG